MIDCCRSWIDFDFFLQRDSSTIPGPPSSGRCILWVPLQRRIQSQKKKKYHQWILVEGTEFQKKKKRKRNRAVDADFGGAAAVSWWRGFDSPDGRRAGLRLCGDTNNQRTERGQGFSAHATSPYLRTRSSSWSPQFQMFTDVVKRRGDAAQWETWSSPNFIKHVLLQNLNIWKYLSAVIKSLME